MALIFIWVYVLLLFWGDGNGREVSLNSPQMDEAAFHVADQYTQGLHQGAAHVTDIKLIQESHMKLLVRGTIDLP